MIHNSKIGKFGETLARNYLIRQGFEILEQNVKISYQEIDIIAKKGQYYIFIEVKTRASNGFDSAEEAFDNRKMKNIKKAIEQYIFKNKINENFIKIDLIAVDISKRNKVAKIKHFKDIF